MHFYQEVQTAVLQYLMLYFVQNHSSLGVWISYITRNVIHPHVLTLRGFVKKTHYWLVSTLLLIYAILLSECHF